MPIGHLFFLFYFYPPLIFSSLSCFSFSSSLRCHRHRQRLSLAHTLLTRSPLTFFSLLPVNASEWLQSLTLNGLPLLLTRPPNHIHALAPHSTATPPLAHPHLVPNPVKVKIAPYLHPITPTFRLPLPLLPQGNFRTPTRQTSLSTTTAPSPVDRSLIQADATQLQADTPPPHLPLPLCARPPLLGASIHLPRPAQT